MMVAVIGSFCLILTTNDFSCVIEARKVLGMEMLPAKSLTGGQYLGAKYRGAKYLLGNMA
jgi:hypothetical protein